MTSCCYSVEEEIRLAKEDADMQRKLHLDCAYEAYKNLIENGHTGYTVGEVTNILTRLIEKKPLTPIHDVPDIWNKVFNCSEYSSYQCTRMPSLYKRVLPDGQIKYHDYDRTFFVDIVTQDTFRNLPKKGYDIIDRLIPIKMPYYPPLGYFKVYCDRNNITNEIKCRYVIEPDGKKVSLRKSDWM